MMSVPLKLPRRRSQDIEAIRCIMLAFYSIIVLYRTSTILLFRKMHAQLESISAVDVGSFDAGGDSILLLLLTLLDCLVASSYRSRCCRRGVAIAVHLREVFLITAARFDRMNI